MDDVSTVPDPPTGYVPSRGSFVQRVGAPCDDLRQRGSRARFRHDEFLLQRGNISDHVLLIEDGLVKVRLLDKGGAQVIVGLYGQGELLGEEGVLSSEPRSADVIGHTNGIVTRVPSLAFHDFLKQHPQTLHALYRIQHSRLRKADHRQLTIASHNAPARVTKQLLAWAETIGRPTTAGVRITGLTRKDLAHCVSASEKRIDAILGEFNRRGLVHTRWKTFLVPSLDDLRKHVHDLEQPNPN